MATVGDGDDADGSLPTLFEDVKSSLVTDYNNKDAYLEIESESRFSTTQFKLEGTGQ